MVRNAAPRVRYPSPNAEANIKRVLNQKENKHLLAVTVKTDDLYDLLDELRALRARNTALWREMSEPLPGLEAS